MDKIWDRKCFEVGGHWPLWRRWKKRMTTQIRQKSNAKKKKKKKKTVRNTLIVFILSLVEDLVKAISGNKEEIVWQLFQRPINKACKFINIQKRHMRFFFTKINRYKHFQVYSINWNLKTQTAVEKGREALMYLCFLRSKH